MKQLSKLNFLFTSLFSSVKLSESATDQPTDGPTNQFPGEGSKDAYTSKIMKN